MAEAQTATPGTRSGSASTGSAASTESTTTRRITQSVGRIVDSAKALGEAQVGIWSMKTMRLVVMAGFGIIDLILIIALMMYGFALLDTALAIRLARLDMPLWFSPLVRGAVYFGLPLIGMLLTWHMMVGFGSPAEIEAEEKRKEASRDL